MDVDKIKTIINSNMDNDIIEDMVLDIIAEDEKSISTILKIINIERKAKNELILKMNMLLSKSLHMDNKVLNKDGHIEKEINEFFEENKNTSYIGNIFKG